MLTEFFKLLIKLFCWFNNFTDVFNFIRQVLKYGLFLVIHVGADYADHFSERFVKAIEFLDFLPVKLHCGVLLESLLESLHFELLQFLIFHTVARVMLTAELVVTTS